MFRQNVSISDVIRGQGVKNDPKKSDIIYVRSLSLNSISLKFLADLGKSELLFRKKMFTIARSISITGPQVFENGEDRSFQNGPSSPFHLPCFPLQFNIMRYMQYSKPQGNQVQLLYYLPIPFLGASFAPDNNQKQRQYVRKLVVVLDFLGKHFGNFIHIIHAYFFVHSYCSLVQKGP